MPVPSFSRRVRGRLAELRAAGPRVARAAAPRVSRAFDERRTDRHDDERRTDRRDDRGPVRRTERWVRRNGDAAAGFFIVCGDDPLALRLVEELASRYNFNVTVILPSRTRNHGPQISRIASVRVVEAEQVTAEALRAARVGSADALALVEPNDMANINSALLAQELHPGLRLVVRMFNMSLGYRVRRLLPDCTVLSDAAMAFPTFLSAALGEVELHHVRVQGRTLYAANRDQVHPRQIMCGLALSSPTNAPLSTDAPDGGPELLPADQDRANLVLAVADGTGTLPLAPDPETGELPSAGRRRRRYQWRLPALREALRMLVDRKLWLAAAGLVALLVLGSIALPLVRGGGLSPLQAAYVTLLTAVGGAQADTAISSGEQLIQVVVTLAGLALVPVITAAVVEAVLNARLALALGRLRQPVADHVVVVGLGNVGTRVIRGLHEFGVPVVAIDRAETARGVELARRLNIPLIIGDASAEATLRAACVETSRALVVLSTDDNVNLEAALNGRALKPDLRVVLRLFDGDFARRVQRAFGVALSHSVSYLAAPAFAAALMDRDVLGTIPVGRRVLLVAEVPVGPGSELDGRLVGDATSPNEAFVIGLHVHLALRPRWTPPAGQRIEGRDRLIVIATRAGLARMVERTTSPPPLPPPQQPAEPPAGQDTRPAGPAVLAERAWDGSG